MRGEQVLGKSSTAVVEQVPAGDRQSGEGTDLANTAHGIGSSLIRFGVNTRHPSDQIEYVPPFPFFISNIAHAHAFLAAFVLPPPPLWPHHRQDTRRGVQRPILYLPGISSLCQYVIYSDTQCNMTEHLSIYSFVSAILLHQ